MTELKSCRLGKKLTQLEASKRIGISLRSYIMYENDERKTRTAKYRFLLQELQKINLLDEEHGILTLGEIKSICTAVFMDYPVDFCYLFGSYAKGQAKNISDIDLLISTEVSGLQYYEMAERLRESLKKKIDLLDVKQLLNNEELLKEVLKDGIKIYG